MSGYVDYDEEDLTTNVSVFLRAKYIREALAEMQDLEAESWGPVRRMGNIGDFSYQAFPSGGALLEARKYPFNAQCYLEDHLNKEQIQSVAKDVLALSSKLRSFGSNEQWKAAERVDGEFILRA